MTDDVIYSTQYYMRYINRAILANLHHRPLKLGRLIVLKETHQRLQKFCSHGNSLFSSPHLLYFNLLVIFSTKNIKWCHKLELTYSYACWIIHTRHHQQISKWNAKGAQKSRLYWRGQFASQTIETWQANSSKGKTPTTIKVLFPWQLTLFQSPPTLHTFNLFVIFSTKNSKWCHKLKLTYSYACWTIHTRYHQQISKWNAKGAQKSLLYWGGLEPSMLP